MKKIIIFLFILAFSLTGFGQAIDSYVLSLSGAYLPGGGGRSEIYSKENSKIQHTASEKHRHGRKYRFTSKNQKLKNDLQIEHTINQLDSLFRLTEFRFTVSKSMIESITADNRETDFLNFTDRDIDKFFSHGDTVIISLNDIPKDIFEGIVIDGYPYLFELRMKRSSQDTIYYKFDGNFVDKVETSNIKYWLPVFIAYRQNKFFETMPMEEYFTENNIKYVLERFIEWTK